MTSERALQRPTPAVLDRDTANGAVGSGDVATRPSPRIWLILSEKLGDNIQVRTIGDALRWPYEERRLVVRPRYRLGKPFVRASLHHIDPAKSDSLEPPWPDLLITSGRRMLNAALWIKKRSGGRTRIVIVGRPRRYLERCDLVVTSAQYRLPQTDNILHLAYPLLSLDEAAVDTAAEQWREELSALPRPVTALMVGGKIKPVRFDGAVAREMASAVGRYAQGTGGSLLVAVSRRTGPAIVEGLASSLPPGAILYRWSADSERNPYRALLKLADRLVVTGDSVSMMMEGALLGRPLAIYPLPPASWFTRMIDRVTYGMNPAAGAAPPGRLLRAVTGLLYRLGLGYPRDLDSMHRTLIQDGLAVPFGAPFKTSGARAPNELERVAARIRALFKR